MKKYEFIWTLVDREDVLDVLLGEHEPLYHSDTFPESSLFGTKLAIGYKNTPQKPEFACPSLIVIPDGSATETLSWLRTFSNDVSPLSQYGRVLLLSEWRQYAALRDILELSEPRSYRWASMIVGEALCQIEGETNLHNLPLSRFAGCFTTPIARASIIWRNKEVTANCSDRLRLLESDNRFARRTVGVEQLQPIWSIANSNTHSGMSPYDAVDVVMEIARTYFRSRNQDDSNLSSSILTKEFHGLNSDSVEERVSTFNKLSSHILYSAQSSIGTTPSAMIDVVLAAAAFLVGRSTSHVFLLQRIQKIAPTAAAWFGAIAALVGPRLWDKAWLRLAKGAERLLRPEFNWLDVPNADICWGEFTWFARTFDKSEIFLDLPKMLSRTLNIEIVPGSTCQFRIGNGTAEIESKSAQVISDRERQLSDIVGQFLALAQYVESKVERSSLSSHVQSQLPLESNGNSEVNKGQRAKKPRKSSTEK